ncbi:MAG: transglutaminase domain-containing protein [Prolixibacteraceae bacterium]|nr:transglutaminase domain-containing protein [Prolixibacteraceae bacterium]
MKTFNLFMNSQNKYQKMVLKMTTIFLIVFIVGCEKDDPFPSSGSYFFPAGRSFLTSSDYYLSINDNELEPELLFDSCGGYWIKIDEAEFKKGDTLKLQITRNKTGFTPFKEAYNTNETFVSPSYYIDYENSDFASKAVELTENMETNIEKAKRLKKFVISYLNFDVDYRGSFRDKVSKTYEIGYGTCMNFSRLHVAMCRAANVPARTVWGVVYGHNNDLVYDYHHQWAEIQDEEGYWHPMDFNYTTDFDLNDIRYLDLIYSAEENTILKNRAAYKILSDSLHWDHDYPIVPHARMGFNLADDNRPESMTILYEYKYD